MTISNAFSSLRAVQTCLFVSWDLYRGPGSLFIQQIPCRLRLWQLKRYRVRLLGGGMEREEESTQKTVVVVLQKSYSSLLRQHKIAKFRLAFA